MITYRDTLTAVVAFGCGVLVMDVAQEHHAPILCDIAVAEAAHPPAPPAEVVLPALPLFSPEFGEMLCAHAQVTGRPCVRM